MAVAGIVRRISSAARSPSSRLDAAGEVAQLGQGLLGLVVGLVHQRLRRLGVAGELLPGPSEIHDQGGQPRLGAVVQVAFDPPVVGVVGAHGRGAHGALLGEPGGQLRAGTGTQEAAGEASADATEPAGQRRDQEEDRQAGGSDEQAPLRRVDRDGRPPEGKLLLRVGPGGPGEQEHGDGQPEGCRRPGDAQGDQQHQVGGVPPGRGIGRGAGQPPRQLLLTLAGLARIGDPRPQDDSGKGAFHGGTG